MHPPATRKEASFISSLNQCWLWEKHIIWSFQVKTTLKSLTEEQHACLDFSDFLSTLLASFHVINKKFHPARLLNNLLSKKAGRVEFFPNPARLFRSALQSKYLLTLNAIDWIWANFIFLKTTNGQLLREFFFCLTVVTRKSCSDCVILHVEMSRLNSFWDFDLWFGGKTWFIKEQDDGNNWFFDN